MNDHGIGFHPAVSGATAPLEFAQAAHHVGRMRIDLNWRKPLFYVLLPILVFMAFVGFPPPFPPVRPTKPGQEQSAPAEERQAR